MSDADVMGLVLAGGHSTRMGRDKAALEYHGRPQIEEALALLKSCCGSVLVSCRPDQAERPPFAGHPCLCDRYDNLGPMSGLLTALETHPDRAWLVVACDLPQLDRATLEALVAGRDPSRMATAFRGRTDGLPDPLCAIYEPAARDRLDQLVREGILCLRKALIRSEVRLLDPPDPLALENANAPDECDAMRRALASGEKRAADASAPEGARRSCDACPPRKRRVEVRLYAVLRDAAGCSDLTLDTAAHRARDVYAEVARRFGWSWPAESFRAAINDAFCPWDHPVREADCVHIVPPAAGG